MSTLVSELAQQQSRASEDVQASGIRVFLMDLWSYSPHYDRYLYEALRREDVDVRLGSVAPYQDPAYFRRNGIHTSPGLLDVVPSLRLSHDRLRRPLMLFECCINMLALLIRFLFSRPDIVHVQWVPLVRKLPVELWFLKLVRAMGSKLVYTVHNVLPHDTGNKFVPVFRSVYQQMDALICHTQGAKEQLVQEFSLDPDRVCVIPHGPLLHEVNQLNTAEAKRELGISDEEVLVLWQGIIRPYKGLDFLLEAWRKVVPVNARARLLLAGSGTPEAEQALRERVSALGLESSVSLHLRYLGDEELPVYFGAADIAVYPYKAVTTSGALMTAVAYGKAIVASNLPAFEEVLSQAETAPLLVEYGDVDAFAEVLKRLIDNPDERERAAHSTARLNDTNSWDAIAKKTRRCYATVLQAKKARTILQ